MLVRFLNFHHVSAVCYSYGPQPYVTLSSIVPSIVSLLFSGLGLAKSCINRAESATCELCSSRLLTLVECYFASEYASWYMAISSSIF